MRANLLTQLFLTVILAVPGITTNAQEWHITGNSGTKPGTNFLGTTDAKALLFKVNNKRSGYIDFVVSKANTSFGFRALDSSAGASNTAIGYNASFSNTAGYGNSALGAYALYSNTSGFSNVALGVGALYKNTDRTNLVAVGDSALYNNGTGALGGNEAAFNTAIGSKALYSNTTGFNNTANGYQALYSNTTGYSNTAYGTSALFSNTNGLTNTAIGLQALYSNTTGNSNTAVGYEALISNTIGSNNTANGYLALLSNTTGANNTANGFKALSLNTTGYYNTADGYEALHSNTTGYSNTANGYEALQSSTTANSNTAYGTFALSSNTTGNSNTASGKYVLYLNTTGHDNTANGNNALYSNISGYNNTAVGAFADVITSNMINATAIGYDAIVNGSNKVRIGNISVSSIGGQVGWTTFSDGRYKRNIKQDVQGLAFINSLQPITYTVDIDGLNKYFDKGRKHDSGYEKMQADMKEPADKAAKIIYNGFIAQDVEKAAAKLNYNFSGVDKPETPDGLYGLRYADFVVPLVKAVQELSKINDAKDSIINAMKNNYDVKIDALQNQIDELKSMIVSNQSVNSKQSSVISSSTLQQNIPNPFSNTTTISYTLAQKFTTAQIVITDKSGKTLKAINISGSGRGSVNVDGSTLVSGAYQYSLMIDGRLIDTKQMVLAK